MEPTEESNTILPTPIPAGRRRRRGTETGFGTGQVQTVASPIARGNMEKLNQIDSSAAPGIQVGTKEFEDGVPSLRNNSDLTLRAILNRLENLERKFADVFEASETADSHWDRRSYQDARRDYRRETIFTEGGTAISPGKPKMEKPETFDGEYSVLYSVLNWLRTVRKYLRPHDIPLDMYPAYAYTYMGKSVKAWYDCRFAELEDPSWELFESAITERYLPDDHVIQVTKKYERIIQTGTLEAYVEKWQSLMVAVKAAGIARTDQDHVIQFVTGLAKMEDRKSILDKDPKTLEDVYRAVTKIRHYSLMAHEYQRTGDTESESRSEEGEGGSEIQYDSDTELEGSKPETGTEVERKGEKEIGQGHFCPKKKKGG
jgi:hypothetical protein